MELKPQMVDAYKLIGSVLIVPYGIETTGDALQSGFESVLIVPYGIET